MASKSTNGKPGKKTKLRGYGFIFGKKAYMHVRGHGIKTNKFLKRVTAPCGTFTVRKAFVPSNAPVGKYRVQFDHKKSYKKNRAGSIAYELTVFRTFNSTAFGGAGWALDPIAALTNGVREPAGPAGPAGQPSPTRSTSSAAHWPRSATPMTCSTSGPPTCWRSGCSGRSRPRPAAPSAPTPRSPHATSSRAAPSRRPGRARRHAACASSSRPRPTR